MSYTFPKTRLSNRSFVLCYVRKEGLRPEKFEPRHIIGYLVFVHFGKKDKPQFLLSACSENWRIVDNNSFDSYEELFLVAENYYHIPLKAWKGSHPERGMKLYSQPRTTIERLHRKLLKNVDFYRYRGFTHKSHRSHAYYAGALSGKEKEAHRRLDNHIIKKIWK